MIQVWEINTNPMICTSTVAGGSVRESLQGEFAAKFQRVLEDLDAHHGAAVVESESIPGTPHA